jgi:hypothetical protein
VVHRADPERPSRPRGRRPPPDGGPASTLLQPMDPGPAPLTPHRARVRIREIPQRPPRRPGIWIGSYRVRALDVITVLLVAAAVAAWFLWPHSAH